MSEIGPHLELDGRPAKDGGRLVFTYALRNHGPGAAYVMDATPSVDRASGAAKASPLACVVTLGPGEDATVARVAAPLPTDRRVAVPVLPLARLLAEGAALEGTLEAPLPLAETSPYFADLLLRAYQPVDIQAVVFAVGYWPAALPGLVAAPAPYAPEYSVVACPDPFRAARIARQRFPSRGLVLFRRDDGFVRDLGG